MRTKTTFTTTVIAALAFALGACADDGPADRLAQSADLASTTEQAPLAPGSTVEFRASEFAFAPMELTAEPGIYHGVLVNDGSVAHDIVFGDGAGQSGDEGHAGHPVAQPGETVEFDFEVPADGIEFWCSIPGHADAGMTGVVYTPSSVADGAADLPAEAEPASAGVVESNPNAAPYEWRDPVAPARGEGDGVTLVPGGADDGGDLIDVEMVVEERLMTVAEGYEQLVWTFNGTVPGPVIRTRVGDTVRVHLVNPPDASVEHSIDFHASQVAWNDEMRSIAPGEDLIYEFTTDYAGVWMYHCGTDPVLHHIANGMFGMVIVEPEGGFEPADDEFFLVQNEWYLGPQGEVSSYAKANQAAPEPDFVMFNGVAFQYRDQPIEVGTGDNVRLFVLDVGPSIDSSFHIVGTIFHDVVKEGVPLAAGNTGNWASQAIDLAPAQGAVIELVTPEDGLYPIVTHAFNLPGRGALGLLQAGDGQP